MINVGQTIKTVYGMREVVKVNKSSVLVKHPDGETIKVDMRQVRIMN